MENIKSAFNIKITCQNFSDFGEDGTSKEEGSDETGLFQK
jgi:hypothetical protein